MRTFLWVAVGALVLASAPGCSRDNTYATCFTTADCNDRFDECWEVILPAAATAGRFCSRACFDDFDCESNFGYAGVCYSLDDAIPLCYQQCVFHSDCWAGNICIELVVAGGFADFVCVPDNI
jgi:hypothetical protein